mmetsp:Transcript_3364/g.13880  ORF Transcript_3364/g.13880 Transcript_3364/m.13880 type:complete len:265 (+) Transcript_3364:2583-3377(+)
MRCCGDSGGRSHGAATAEPEGSPDESSESALVRNRTGALAAAPALSLPPPADSAASAAPPPRAPVPPWQTAVSRSVAAPSEAVQSDALSAQKTASGSSSPASRSNAVAVSRHAAAVASSPASAACSAAIRPLAAAAAFRAATLRPHSLRATLPSVLVRKAERSFMTSSDVTLMAMALDITSSALSLAGRVRRALSNACPGVSSSRCRSSRSTATTTLSRALCPSRQTTSTTLTTNSKGKLWANRVSSHCMPNMVKPMDSASKSR